MQWTEKYRPKRVQEIVGHEKEVNVITNMMNNGGLPNILLIGPPGTGKTATAYVIAQQLLGEDMAGNFSEINGSDDRTMAIRKTVLNAARTMPLNGKLRIILMDEADGLARDTQEALRRPLENSGKTLFIFTANRKEEFIQPLLSRLMTFVFGALTEKDIVQRLKAICKTENLKLSAARLKKIAQGCEGDVRLAINELQKEAMMK